jgi:hypothetical protein
VASSSGKVSARGYNAKEGSRMPIYVDDMAARYNRMIMSHMIADSTEELLAMAELIGVNRRWLQKRGKPGEHFDICRSKRVLAIRHGAIPLTTRELARMTLARKRAAVAEGGGLDALG